MYIACILLLTLTGSCWSQMAPPPGHVASAGSGAAGGMGGSAGMGGAGMVGGAGGVGGIPTHLLGEPGENPFALDGICWNLEKQVRASLPPNASPKEQMADKIQMAITSYLNGGGEIPSTGGGNIACVIRDAKKKAGKVKVMNADLATAVADKVADAGCRIPCFDPTTGTWAQPPPGMAPPSLTPALGEPMTALPLNSMSASGTFAAMGAADPYVNNMAGPGPYDPGMGSIGGMGGMGSTRGMGPGPNGPLRGAGPYDPSMRSSGPYDPGMRTSGPYDPSMGGLGPYDPGMRASGPYDPSMGGLGPYDSSMGASGPYDPSMGASGPYDPSMGASGPYDPNMGRPGRYDPSMGGPDPYDPSMAGPYDTSMGPYGRSSGMGPGAYDPVMTGSGPYDPSMGGPGPFDPGFNGPGAFGQGIGERGPSNSYPGHGGMGPDPYPADVGARSPSLQDSLQERHLSKQMALHERRRMGPTHLQSQMDMGNGFQDHPLSRKSPNPNTFTERSARQLSPSVSDTQPRSSFGQQTGFSNTDQPGGLSSRFSESAQSVLDSGTNSLSQGTASFTSRNMAGTGIVASTNSPAEVSAQSSQNLVRETTLKSSPVSSQALSSSGTGIDAIQAVDGMADRTGGQAQGMLSQPGTQQQALSRQSQLASDQAGLTFNRNPSVHEITQSKMSSGMSHQQSAVSQDFPNARLQNSRRGFSDPGMMSTGRMTQTSRDASFLSDHPSSSMSHSSDMISRPNWRMSTRSNSHFSSHNMGRETALGGSSQLLQSRDRHQQLRSGSSFGSNSRRMSWNSPRLSDRMSSFSRHGTSPSFTRSRMGQRSQFDTRRLGMQSGMNSQFNGQRRFLSSAVSSTSKTFSKRPTVNSVHETPGVAETGKNGDTFSMTSSGGLGGIASSDTVLKKKETLSTLDTQKVSKFDKTGETRLAQGTVLTDKATFLNKSDLPLNQDKSAGVPDPGIRERTHVAKERILGGTGVNNDIQTLRKDAEIGLSNNGLVNTQAISGRDRPIDPVPNTNIQTDSFGLTLNDVVQTDLYRKSEQGKLPSRNAVGSDPPSSRIFGDVVNKAQGIDAISSTSSDGGKGSATVVDGGKLSNAELASRFRPPVVIRKADINSPVIDPQTDKYGGRLRITQSLGTNDKIMDKESVHGGSLRLGHGLPSSQPADVGVSQHVTSSRNSNGVEYVLDMARHVSSRSHLLSNIKGHDNLHEIHVAADHRLGRAGHLQTPRLARSFNGVINANRPSGSLGSSVADHRGTGTIDILPTRHRTGLDTPTGYPMGDRHAADMGFRNEGPFAGEGMGVAADVGFGNQGPDMGFGKSLTAAADMGFRNAGPYSVPDMGMRNPMSATDVGFGHTDHIHGPGLGMDGGHGMGRDQGMGVGHVMDGTTGMDGGHGMGRDQGMGVGQVMDGTTGMGGGQGMGMGLDSHLSTNTDPHAMGPDPLLLSLL